MNFLSFSTQAIFTEHAHETERKLLFLMDAVHYQNAPGPRPVTQNATTSAAQQTISVQRQLQIIPLALPAVEMIQRADKTVRFLTVRKEVGARLCFHTCL